MGSAADEGSSAGSGRRRLALAVAVALVPVVPIVIGLLLGSEGRSGAVRATPFLAVHADQVPTAPRLSAAPPAPGATVARIVKPTEIRVRPGGRRTATLTPRTEFGSPRVLYVARQTAGWLGVISPAVGNGRIGWIPASAARTGAVSHELRISLSARRLEVRDRGKLIARYIIAIGRPAAPTPTGRFAVTDRLRESDPSGSYGCCVLALSAHSPHPIQGWTGGDRIAIHSTLDTESIGKPASHGCIRVDTKQGRWLIDNVPLGTPVLIRA